MNIHTWKPRFSESVVRRLYIGKNMTYPEAAKALGVTRKVIWTLLKYYGIPTRRAVKRNQFGPANSSWKGDRATYQALHLRVATTRGKPGRCEVCKTAEKTRSYDWAFVGSDMANVYHFKRMCRSCHWKHDGKIKNITGHAH